MAQSRPTPQRFSAALMGESRKPGAQTMSSAAPLDAPSTSAPKQAAAQHDPASVAYTDQAPACQGCTHFQGPNACEVVSGPIQPTGWCKLFDDGGQGQ